MLLKKLCFTALCLACMSIADAEPSAAFNTCLDESDGSTLSSMDCLHAEYDRQDKLLNEYYQTAMHNMDSEQKKLLRSAQRSWIDFRDKNCEVESSLAGGQIASLFYSECLMTLTSDRVEQLEAISKAMIGE